MAYGGNATITRSVKIYDFTSGATALVEYRGSSFDVVAFNADVVPAQIPKLRDVELAAIRNIHLADIRDMRFTDNLASWHLAGPVIRWCDINGIAHWVLTAAAGLLGGDNLTVTAEFIG